MTAYDCARNRVRRVGAVLCMLAAALTAAALATAAPSTDEADEAAAWTEIRWPFSFDPWGPGRAFRCSSAACGFAAELYVRPKIGFCNCTIGVADDEEVDVVGDMPVIGPDFVAQGAGRVITVGSMRGRERMYRIATGPNMMVHALAVVTSKRCDLMVALLASGEAITPEAQRAASVS